MQPSPWVVTLDNFISDEEVAAFIEGCHEHFDRSLAGDTLSPVRTSSQCWCSDNACARDELTQSVAERISNLTRAPVRCTAPNPCPACAMHTPCTCRARAVHVLRVLDRAVCML